jgi:hypothetical protein
MKQKKNKYRSGFERQAGDLLEPEGFLYEPYKVDYVVHHKYTPDFVYQVNDLEAIVVEAKGFFRPGDTQKYKAIRTALEDMHGGCHELVFLLQSPMKQVRKGAILTMSQWCTKEGIRWFHHPWELIEYANSK